MTTMTSFVRSKDIDRNDANEASSLKRSVED